MSKQWNKDIHDRLKDFPKKAPEGLLDDINSEMLRRGLEISPTSDISHSPYPAIIRQVVAVAAMLLLLLGLGYQWIQYPDIPSVPPTIVETTQTPHELIIEPSFPISGKEETISVKITRQKQVITNLYSPSADTIYIIKVDSLPLEENSEKEKQEKETVTPNLQRKRDVYQRNLLAYTPKRKKTSLTAGIYYSGVVDQENLDFSKNTDHDFLYNDTPQQSPEFLGNATNNEYPLSHAHLEEKERHHLPIQFGLSIRYNINERWSIQSGLTYSYLASDLSKSNQRISYQTKQKLHYIGIPLQAGYQIWTSHRFKGYLTVGGQVEKLISGKATTDYSVDNQHQSTSTENISDNRLLFSALTSIGAEYALGKDFSLYAEPGIHYYFKNGNGLKTHYNDQPLNFNITIGFRFHWNK